MKNSEEAQSVAAAHIVKKFGKERTERTILLEAIDQAGLKADGKDPRERTRDSKCQGKCRTPDRTSFRERGQGPSTTYWGQE